MSSQTQAMPAQAGIGLRSPHYQAILETRPQLGWLEVHSENFYGAGGQPHYYLQRLADHYPLSFHGVGLSLGSADGLNRQHLTRLKQLLEIYQPRLVSEHLSWGQIGGVYANDLLPLPLNDESLAVMINHVDQAQGLLDRQILIENPSNYLAYVDSQFSEVEFLHRLCAATGCGILLDINNVYVSARNIGLNAKKYLNQIDFALVGEIHLAGHSVKNIDGEELLIDDHGSEVSDEVWELFNHFLLHKGVRPTLIEWDSSIPALDLLLAERLHAQRLIDAQGASRVA